MATALLTPTNAQQRFRSRMDEIDLAIIGESARWGRGKTRDATWLPACNSVLNTYLTQRRDIIISHFRNRGWFPSLDAPGYSVMNTQVASGHVLRVSGHQHVLLHTDGSDPRLPDGSINPVCHRGHVRDRTHRASRAHHARGATGATSTLGSEPAAAGQLTWRDPGFPDDAWRARTCHPRFRRQRDHQPRGDRHAPLRERRVRTASHDHLPAPHLYPRLDQ